MAVSDVFVEFKTYLNEEHDTREEIRTSVREFEQLARDILTHLQTVHQKPDSANVTDVCNKASGMFDGVKTQFSLLASKIPTDQYYRFHDHWRFLSQRLCFLSSFVIYGQTDSLASREQVAEMLGVCVQRTDGFHVDLDDYLMGLLQLASELSRLAVNSVTAGDYTRPVRIAKFVAELDSGFRLLNLKNDALRKRFDGLKYDLKKVEEVVYDITIRGLLPTGGDSTVLGTAQGDPGKE